MRAWFEIQVESCTTRSLACFFERQNLCMLDAVIGVRASSNFAARCVRYDCAYYGIWRDEPYASSRQLQRSAHVLFVVRHEITETIAPVDIEKDALQFSRRKTAILFILIRLRQCYRARSTLRTPSFGCRYTRQWISTGFGRFSRTKQASHKAYNDPQNHEGDRELPPDANHRYSLAAPRRSSGEQRLHEFPGIKRQQIARFFPYADKPDRQSQFTRNRHHHAAFGCAIELGQHDSRNSR